MKKLVALLLIISLIGISGCTNKDSTDSNNGGNLNISGSEDIGDNDTEYINNGQVDVTSESEYDTKNGSSI